MRPKARALRQLMKVPPGLVRVALGEPDEVDGRRLHPQTQLLVFLLNQTRQPDMSTMTLEEFRRRQAEVDRLVSHSSPAVREVWDEHVPRDDGPGLLVRFYKPRRAGPGLLIYFHGGGFVVGSLESHDALCRFLSERGGVTVMAVDYRLAPEHPFPAAVDDAMAAFTFALSQAERLGVEADRVAVGGDSSGANLAAVVAQSAAAGGGPGPALQLLLYPIVDLSGKARSYELFGQGYGLTAEIVDWGIARYLEDEAAREDPRVSPLKAEPHPGQGPAFIMTAGFDVLHDEGEAYAGHLEAAGVEVDYRCAEGLIHGFGRFFHLMDPAREAMEQAAEALRRLSRAPVVLDRQRWEK